MKLVLTCHDEEPPLKKLKCALGSRRSKDSLHFFILDLYVNIYGYLSAYKVNTWYTSQLCGDNKSVKPY